METHAYNRQISMNLIQLVKNFHSPSALTEILTINSDIELFSLDYT